MELSNEKLKEIINNFRNSLTQSEKDKIFKNKEFHRILESENILRYLGYNYLGNYGKTNAKIIADVTAYCSSGSGEDEVSYLRTFNYTSKKFAVLIEEETKIICDNKEVIKLNYSTLSASKALESAKRDALEEISYEVSRVHDKCSSIDFTKYVFEYDVITDCTKYYVIRLNNRRIGYLINDHFKKDFNPPMSDNARIVLIVVLLILFITLTIVGIIFLKR